MAPRVGAATPATASDSPAGHDEILRPTPGGDAWRPLAFPATDDRARANLAALVLEGGITVHDTIRDQLAELVETREPSATLSPDELQTRIADHLRGAPPARHGTWFLYPWSRRAVHLLPEPEFREVRSSRNRNKISAAEQDRLREARIGVVGLSVGSACAVTLAMEQVGGELLLADFDRLGLSNMNRLRAGVHELGLPKALLTARAIAELDPYMHVRPFLEGVTDANMDAFLCPDGRPLDLLVEECDDLYVKVRIRDAARAHRIPVLMETNDRGLLDVERFDLEPGRPSFHGLAGTLDAERLRGLDAREKARLVLRILGTVSPRLAASLREVKSTIVTWPQLASAVSLGAALVTDTARRLLLGTLTASGRYYVDLDELVRDGAGAAPPAAPEPTAAAQSRARPPPVVPPDVQRIQTLVGLATLAPSGGNCQPWRFSWNGERLRLAHDVARSRSLLDYDDLASWLAFGAAAENVALGAAAMGLDLALDLAPEPGAASVVCDMRFAEQRGAIPPGDEALAAAIPLRATNRRLSPRVPLPHDARAALERAAAGVHGAALHLVEDQTLLAELGALLGRGDRLRFLSRTLHDEMMNEVRWTPEEVHRTCDGLDVATLELSAPALLGMRLISSWQAMKLLGRLGGGRALEKPAQQSIAAASAVGLVSVPARTREDYFAGGRAMQRVWLRATTLGLAFQPVAPLTYLFARVEAGGGAGLSPAEVAELRDLRARFAAVFPGDAGRGEPMLFRLSYAPPPTARSLRRPLVDVLRFE